MPSTAFPVPSARARPWSWPLKWTVPAAGSVNGKITFDATQHLQRSGLLLQNGTVFAGFGSHGDNQPCHGSLIGYNTSTLERVSVFNSTPGGNEGAFWQSGRAPAADDDGSIYLVNGNGTAGLKSNCGNSILRLDRKGSSIADFFTPYDVADLNDSDSDLMAGPLLIPGTKFVLASGKAGVIYVLDRTNVDTVRRTTPRFPSALTPEVRSYSMWHSGTAGTARFSIRTR